MVSLHLRRGFQSILKMFPPSVCDWQQKVEESSDAVPYGAARISKRIP
jgi:hypothetical protein